MKHELLTHPLRGILSQICAPKPAEVPHFAEVYARTWTPFQHFEILHGNSPSDGIISVNFKLQAESVGFWQTLENDRVAKSHAAREARAAAGVKRLGGKARTKDYSQFRLGSMKERLLEKGDDLDQILSKIAGIPDVYVNQNSFYKRRLVERFKEARHLYIDLDDLAENYGKTAPEVASDILAFCDRNSLPRPSFINSTGVGLCLVWRHTPIRWGDWQGLQLEDWQDAMATVFEVFKLSFEPDPAAKDVTRIFRLCGTVNSKNGNVVHPIYIDGNEGDPTIYDFPELRECFAAAALAKIYAPMLLLKKPELEPEVTLLPKSKPEPKKPAAEPAIADLFAQTQVAIPAPPEPAKPVVADVDVGAIQKRQLALMTDYRYAAVLSDLYLLRQHRGGVPYGQRDQWLYLVTVCLAQGGLHGAAIDAEVAALAPVAGLSLKEAKSYMSATVSRANKFAKGGDDHRYHAANHDIRLRLGVTERELQTIPFSTIHKDGSGKVDPAYEREKKALQRGQTKRPEAMQDRKAKAALRDAEIRNLYAAGMSQREIAQHLKCAKTTVSRALSPIQQGGPLVPLIVERGRDEREALVRQKYVDIARMAYDMPADSEVLPQIYEEAIRYELEDLRRQRERQSLALTPD